MKKQANKTVFENIGGSFQFKTSHAGDLYKILDLDATAWAALCVPTASLNGDPAFFAALDSDHNGMIRTDEVKLAIRWLLDVLKKYGVKVTFFVKGSTAYPEYLTRAAEEGHAVAIHTYSHNYNELYASDDAFMADLIATQNAILKYTGQKSMLTRFPGGSSNTISANYSKGIMSRLVKKLPEMGYQYFDWNVDSNDAGGAKDADEVFKNVTEGVVRRQNSVVLQHDTKSFSIDAVERIIAWGLCNGYTFAALDANSPTCHHGVWN